MKKLTRRKLITQASVGTGAVGVLAITAACAPATTITTPNIASPSTPSANTIDEPMAVFVTDPAKGTLTIMKQDREITVNNPGLANSLLALA